MRSRCNINSRGITGSFQGKTCIAGAILSPLQDKMCIADAIIINSHGITGPLQGKTCIAGAILTVVVSQNRCKVKYA